VAGVSVMPQPPLGSLTHPGGCSANWFDRDNDYSSFNPVDADDPTLLPCAS